MKRTPEFIQLLTSSQSRLYGYILSLLYDADQANDVLQQTNVILWEKEEEFSLGSNFIAWSFQIAYFQVLAHRKQLQRERLSFDSDLLADIANVSREAEESFESRQKLMRQCLQKLNRRQQEIVYRRYQSNASLDSIAIETANTVNAVKQLLFRARSALARCINQGLEQEMNS
ncbi:sigma-70 family RNA polymerase sigma factor [Neorhodopirellula pilleata]|uniref:RNA polymerase sigma factor n=1 Tax=Neorhodopirellula pilleata TaxID=2714738 RepID=A0A5C6A8Q0_9BACT|nr:sigma-70 family RNA polymerase sigma factor [Neorhodopirellula pilleata]TWT96344.1 RNA polymerase sigma factor [Neorhodopirellula pilleata]